MSAQFISRDELKTKLDRGDTFRLVLALAEPAFKAQHIPGSTYMASIEDAAQFNKDEDIVVYCTGGTCNASRWAYDVLVSRGYSHVRRYAGGLEDWHSAGYPLEGEMAGDR